MTGQFPEAVERVLRERLRDLLDGVDRSRERLAEREQDVKQEAVFGERLNAEAGEIERTLQEHGHPVQSRGDRERDLERKRREANR